jgi:prenyl protein peptidase
MILTTPQGPVSEELIWRSLTISIHILARFSAKQIIFLTPLYFGIAHVHHLYEFRITNPGTPLFVAVARSLFQFTYTSLFGFFAAFVFLRTGNVYPAILTHTFCNWVGLPRFYGRVGVQAGEPISPPSAGESQGDESPLQDKGIIWTVIYYIILVAGAVGFYKQLFPLTESSHALMAV